MSAAMAIAAAAPLLLLPLAYLVWWVDRFRLFPMARFTAVFATSSAAGLLLASRWPTAPTGGVRLAGSAMRVSALLAERLPADVVDVLRLVALELAVLTFLLARARVDTLLDGVVYGLACGVGFALPAGWLLVASAPAVEGTELAATALTPVAAGAACGVAVAWGRLSLRWAWRCAAIVAGAVAAVAVVVASRAAGEASRRPWVGLAILVAAIAGAAAVALAVEVRVATRELAEEARLGVVPTWVAEVVPRYWRRVRSSWWPRRDERRALSRLLVELASRKRQVRHLGGERATVYSLEVGRLRERARRLLDPARSAEAPAEEGE